MATITGLLTPASGLIDLADLRTAVLRTARVFPASSRAELQADDIDASIDIVHLGGYATAGDGGGALYKRAASQPSHAGKVQSADGTWWEYVPPGCVNAKAFGAGLGDADDSTNLAAARDAALALDVPLVFPAGTFNIGTLDLAFSRLKVHCTSETILNHVGTARMLTMDAGTSGYLYDIHLTGYPTLQGHATTTDLLYTRSCHHLRIDVRARDCHTAIRCDFTVLSKIVVVHSANQGGWAFQNPARTIVLDKRIRSTDGAIEASTSNEVWVISEGVTVGIDLPYAQWNRFLGGTSEANGSGIVIAADSTGNTFDNIFMEANTSVDISDASDYTQFNNCHAGSAVGSFFTGSFIRVNAGYIRNLNVGAAAVAATLRDVNLPGTFTNSSTTTTLENCHNNGALIASRPHGGWRAHKNGTNQTGVASATWTKVDFGNEQYDTLSVYDWSNSTATPTRFGHYEITALITFTGGIVSGELYGVAIYKNGLSIGENLIPAAGTSQISIQVTVSDYTDGSAAYTVYAYGGGAGTKTISGLVAHSFVQGKFLF